MLVFFIITTTYLPMSCDPIQPIGATGTNDNMPYLRCRLDWLSVCTVPTAKTSSHLSALCWKTASSYIYIECNSVADVAVISHGKQGIQYLKVRPKGNSERNNVI